MSSVLAGSALKCSIAGKNDRRSSSNRSVEQFPIRSQITFGRPVRKNSLIVKVQILRHNCETFAYCKLPDGSVTGRAKAALVNVCRVGKQICQPGNKSRRQ